ncbi:helix-turn-helix transcriptional regulator [Duganella sp. S19_KUP01_CR8]|uniref:helix-turn-helix transcriptional regulator n=1 Tax=Duganella sp. S19_KUP01_CR8 TaxID=3025502 RepID=UPI002FCDC16A
MTDRIHTLQSLRVRYAARLLQLRRSMGLSQTQLAQKAGVHRSYPSQIERGVVNISLDSLEKLFEVLLPELHDGRPLRIRVGEAIRKVRGEKISQEQLSLLVEMSLTTIGRIERGEMATSIDQIERLAQALGMKGEDLLENSAG